MNSFFILVTIVLVCVLIFNVFARAPSRDIPSNENIVSPAMGKIIAIHDLENAELSFLKGEIKNDVEVDGVTLPAYAIVIELNLRDIHVQRAPITGTVIRKDHYDGKHKNALGKAKADLVNSNEKMLTIFKSETEAVGVIQVAGRAARRVRSKVHVGQLVQKGEVFGKILLGSQVIVIVPQTRTLLVQVGDRLVDGETVIAG